MAEPTTQRAAGAYVMKAARRARRLLNMRVIGDELTEFDASGYGLDHAPAYGRLEIGHVLDLVQQGADHERIMAETGLTRKQINELLRKVAIALGYEEEQRRRKRTLTPSQARRAVEMARAGTPRTAIAADLGVSEGVVRYELTHRRGSG